MTRRTRSRSPTAATPPTCRSPTCSAGRRGSCSGTAAARWARSTAARPGCSSLTCTSGRAPNGYAESVFSIGTSPASGKTTATTCTETHGGNSGTRATEYLADRYGRGGHRGDGPGPYAAAGGPRVAGPRCWPTPGRAARRRPADRRRRIPGRTGLLDRLGSWRAAGDHGGAGGRRRGLPLADPRSETGRPDGGPRADRRLLRVGARPRRAAAAGRGRLGRRPVAVYAAGAFAGWEHCSGAAAVLLPEPGRRDLSRRTRCRPGWSRGHPRLDPIPAPGVDRLRPAGGQADAGRGGLARGPWRRRR